MPITVAYEPPDATFTGSWREDGTFSGGWRPNPGADGTVNVPTTSAGAVSSSLWAAHINVTIDERIPARGLNA